MKFGKVHDVSNIDFSMPQHPASTIRVLNKTKITIQTPQLYVGCTGWSMKEWVGKTYPKGAKSKYFLKYYGKQFNTIELNTTHYRIPTFETIEKWKESVPNDFRFCPKIPQSISHSANMGISDGKMEIFCDAILGLGDQLGCCFMQLPPYFKVDRLGLLEVFLEKFPKQIPLAVEIRNEEWFSNTKNGNAFFDLLEQHQISTVITDVAGRRDVLHQRLTTNTAMIRFVGNGLHPTDYSRIDDWMQVLKHWLAEGLKTVYFFPHEPDNILAPEMAKYVVDQMNAVLKLEVRGPNFEASGDNQMSLF